MKYKIPILQTYWGLVEVEAEYIEDAINKAADQSIINGEYVEDSDVIDWEGITQHNNLDEDDTIFLNRHSVDSISDIRICTKPEEETEDKFYNWLKALYETKAISISTVGSLYLDDLPTSYEFDPEIELSLQGVQDLKKASAIVFNSVSLVHDSDYTQVLYHRKFNSYLKLNIEKAKWYDEEDLEDRVSCFAGTVTYTTPRQSIVYD